MAVMMKLGPFVLTFCHWYQNVHIGWDGDKMVGTTHQLGCR
jgi:hypothetical protein